MRTIYGLIIWVCFMVLVSECDNLLVYVLSKVIAAMIMYIAGKLLFKTMSKEELDETI